MAKEPEERAAEYLAEMAALIRTCENQLQETRDFYAAHGIDPDAIKKQVANLPADQRRQLEEAIKRDAEEVEEEVRRAKLDASHAQRTSGRIRTRPMV